MLQALDVGIAPTSVAINAESIQQTANQALTDAQAQQTTISTRTSRLDALESGRFSQTDADALTSTVQGQGSTLDAHETRLSTVESDKRAAFLAGEGLQFGVDLATSALELKMLSPY